jgi:glycosyltransferase involved in cell wall biosynthesis
MPLAVGEAMAMGKPVVATGVGGVGELLGDTGVAVPARNSQALAAAMIATMRQGRDELSARGRAARKRVLERFSVDASADAWEALYSSLIATREP